VSAYSVEAKEISDLHLFEDANRVLSSGRDKRFFAFIHTSGNQRPLGSLGMIALGTLGSTTLVSFP